MSNTSLESTPPICRVDLAALYPACFDWKRPRPLKIGIDRDLIEAGLRSSPFSDLCARTVRVDAI